MHFIISKAIRNCRPKNAMGIQKQKHQKVKNKTFGQ